MGREGTLQTNNTGVCSRCLRHTGFVPTHGVGAFPVYTAYLGSRLLSREVSEASPGLYALPRSKLLRLRYSGSPQRCRLSWACVLCSSQVRAAQVTRCLANAVAETYRLSRPCHCFLGVQPAHLLKWMLTVQNPKKSWLATKPACSLVDDASLGPRLPPFGFGCPLLPVTGGGWASPQPASSPQSFVL